MSINAELLSPCRKLSFFHSTRIKLQDSNETSEVDVSPISKSVNDLSERMLEGVLGLHPDSRNASPPVTAQANGDDDDDGDDDDGPDEINSMDIFLKLFLECDHIFRQVFISQATKCQLSLPLIVTDPRTSKPTLFSLPYHPIFTQSYQTTEKQTRILPIFTEKMYYISFIRFGECSNSYKSKTLNSLLEIPHCFFHSETKGYSYHKVYYDGLVEMNWFLPSNHLNKEQIFHEPLLLLNLRGNAFSFKKQLHFILDISTIVYIFISLKDSTENELKELESILESFNRKICLIIMDTHKTEQMKRFRPLTIQEDKSFYFISNFKNNRANIPGHVIKSVNGILHKFPDLPKMSLEVCKEVALKHEIEIDEDTEVAKLTFPFQEKIDQLFSELLQQQEEQSNGLYDLKSELLPLQLKHWEKWARADRDKSSLMGDYKMSIARREEKKTELRGVLNSARHDQISYLLKPTGPSEFILTLLKTICIHKGNEDNSMFYLWRILQTCLDRLSLRCLYPSSKGLKDNCEGQTDKVRCTGANTLGIEHIMRELGQLYESSMAARKRDEIIRNLDFHPSDLPGFAAKLILSGQSFEVLDGSVTHIPPLWVSAVLRELSKEVGEDKRIFVVTILGIQSSGKSTLLNTMFGLQFPVKAGRCTRGIFMQIIPVDISVSEKLGYHYLVVLDTEGLGAPELMDVPISHDNELATFITGISDLLIVNLFGENQGEFKNILQITILALMKLKLTNAKRKCIFVHQNVADVAARENLSVGKEQLIRLLDNTTVHAARLENFSNYTKFSDVIDYNMHCDTYYIPGLYSTFPPMSVVSPDYSSRCESLKLKITQEYCENVHFQSVSTWTQKMKDVWNSLLSQNFILNYKNILECCAAFEFDGKLNEWTSRFDSESLACLNNNKDFIAVSSLSEIESVYNVGKGVIEKCCKEAVLDFEKEILYYLFEKSEYKDIQADRETQAKNYFNSARYQKQESLLQTVELRFKLRTEVLKIESQFNQMRDAILEKAKEDIIRLNANDDWSKPLLQLENLFEKHWSEWDEALTKECESLPVDIDSDLQEAFRHNSYFDELEFSKESREILIGNNEMFANIRQSDFHFGSSHYKIFIPSKEHFVSPQCAFTDFSDYLLNHDSKRKMDKHDILEDRISNFIQIVSSLCQEFLHSLSKTDPYTCHSFVQMISIICSQIEEFNEREKSDIIQQIVLTPLFMFEFSFYHCCKAATHLKLLQQDFLRDTNTSAQLLNLKKELKPIFIQLCQGVQTEFSCAKALAEIVFMKMVSFLESKLRHDIIPHFQNDINNLDNFKRRSSLQLSILKELASQKKFDQYIAYIDDPINFIRNWIENKFKKYCNNKAVQNEIKSVMLDPVISKLKLSYVAELKSSIQASNSDWRAIFCEKIKLFTKGLKKCDLDILEVYQNPVNNEEEFLEFFSNSFDKMCTPFGWLGWINTTITSAVYTNTRCLTNLLITCQSLCPFCKEPCLLSAEGHKHYCGSLHRPKGLVGYYHESSNTFSIRECTHSMNTDHVIVYNNQRYKYTDYALISPQFASWKILGEDAANSNYWQWVFYTFRHDFVRHYGYSYNPEVNHWSDLSEADVIAQLDLLYEKFLHRVERSYH